MTIMRDRKRGITSREFYNNFYKINPFITMYDLREANERLYRRMQRQDLLWMIPKESDLHPLLRYLARCPDTPRESLDKVKIRSKLLSDLRDWESYIARNREMRDSRRGIRISKLKKDHPITAERLRRAFFDYEKQYPLPTLSEVMIGQKPKDPSYRKLHTTTDLKLEGYHWLFHAQ